MKRMVIINEDLSYSDQQGCSHDLGSDTAFVHACKEPCHRSAVDYTQRSLPHDHPHYLHIEKGPHLYLNMIDPPVPLFQLRSFELFFDFVDRHLGQRPIHIHCNQGQSRAPSLTLLVMAKRLSAITNESYEAAAAEFVEQFPYAPGKGIATFLAEHWDVLGVTQE